MLAIPPSYGEPRKASLLPKASLGAHPLPTQPGQQELGLLVQHPELKISAESAISLALGAWKGHFWKWQKTGKVP